MRKLTLALSLVVLFGMAAILVASAASLAQGVGDGPSDARRRGQALNKPGRESRVLGYQKGSAQVGWRGGGGIGPLALEIADDVPVFPVLVDPDLVLTEPAASQYSLLAAHLSGLANVPNSRTLYYSALINSPDYAIVGWRGVLSSVRPSIGGSLVSVEVIPTFSVPTVIDYDYSETYFVSDSGVIQYINSSDPLGLAGQTPSEIKEY